MSWDEIVDALSKAREEVDRLRAQRDRLLAACERVAQRIKHGWIPPYDLNELAWGAACQAYRDSHAYTELLTAIATAKEHP